MNIITNFEEFKKSIEEYSKNLFEIQTLLNTLELFDTIPSHIEKIFNDNELIFYVSKINLIGEELNLKMKKIKKILKKTLKKTSTYKADTLEPYAGFKVDEKPIIASVDEMVHIKEIEKKESLSFEEINELHISEKGTPIKPISSNKNRDIQCTCPYCNAPSDYIYRTDKKNKYRCKCCKKKFTERIYNYDNIGCFCPHCKHILYVHKDRSNYLVYRCRNDRCSFYIENKTKPANEKLRYKYRSFKFSLNEVNKPNFDCETTINLSRIHHSPKVLGLVLSFYINYACSTRKTSSILNDLFGLRISHQTISNYAEATAAQIQYLNANYEYELSSTLSGDETYITVLGKNSYVFFFSDPIKKIITSYKIYKRRDTKSAVESILMSLNKYKEIPKDLTIITDGNPIYNAAQLFLVNHGIKFNLKQVIGVSNNDDVSKLYRPYKQIEERLNRTYKENYHVTTGYKSLRSANVYMVLYVAFFNFLRKNSSLNYSTPIELDCVSNHEFMYDKWLSLLSFSNNYIS